MGSKTAGRARNLLCASHASLIVSPLLVASEEALRAAESHFPHVSVHVAAVSETLA